MNLWPGEPIPFAAVGTGTVLAAALILDLLFTARHRAGPG
jgi:hypothetical protein